MFPLCGLCLRTGDTFVPTWYVGTTNDVLCDICYSKTVTTLGLDLPRGGDGGGDSEGAEEILAAEALKVDEESQRRREAKEERRRSEEEARRSGRPNLMLSGGRRMMGGAMDEEELEVDSVEAGPGRNMAAEVCELW